MLRWFNERQKMQKSATIKGLAHLKRLHNLLGSTITWEVLSEDKQVRYGIVERRKSGFLQKRIGWRQLPVYYWLGHKFYPQVMLIGDSRKAVLMQMIPTWTKANEEQAEGRFKREVIEDLISGKLQMP
jgi:hypothetical protein